MDEPLSSRNFQAASIPGAGQARRITAWMAAGAGAALARLIGAWLREPRIGAVLRAGILAAWPPGASRASAPSCEPGPGKARPAASYTGRQSAALVCPGGGRQCR